MESFTHQGLTYRTKLITGDHAERFARCLKAHPSFIEVEVVQSPRAKGEKSFYVRYQPARVERQEAMAARQQEARAKRAAEQIFTFVRDADHPYWHCLSHATGNVWAVTEQSCDCPDAEYRCRGTSVVCKHTLALRFAILAEQRIDTF